MEYIHNDYELYEINIYKYIINCMYFEQPNINGIRFTEHIEQENKIK